MISTEKTLTCSDCGLGFAFTNGERKLFASRGYSNDPKRCPICRAAKRIELGDSGGHSSGWSGGDQRSPQRQMFPATCATCGHNTQVPFEPRTGRPVYCSTCYSKARR